MSDPKDIDGQYHKGWPCTGCKDCRILKDGLETIESLCNSDTETPGRVLVQIYGHIQWLKKEIKGEK